MSSTPLDPRPADPTRGGVAAIGNFDGVHRGHCRLLARLRSRAADTGATPVIVSFDPHPLTLLRPALAPRALVWPERKRELLHAAGIRRVLFLETTAALLAMTAHEFFSKVLRERLGLDGLVEGPNFRFGKDRSGDVELLGRLCREAGMSLDVVPIAEGAGAGISSTRIREALERGDVGLAAELLGRPHGIRGLVAVGDRRGAGLGFPTANLVEVESFCPPPGVYAGRVNIKGRVFPAACNLGPNPTFEVHGVKVEVHLVGFEGDLYGQSLEVEFLARLRDVRKFSGPEELKARLALDVAETRRLATLAPPAGFASVLRGTIAEWLRMDVEPALAPVGYHLQTVQLAPDGTLEVGWRAPAAPPPVETHTILFELESMVRRVFPEIQRVESSAAPPDA